MKNRTTILILLACLFAVVPAMQANRFAAMCADRYGTASDDFLPLSIGSDSGCPIERTSSPLERLLIVLTVGCAGAALISAGKVWRDRQQDRALLQGAVFALTRHHSR